MIPAAYNDLALVIICAYYYYYFGVSYLELVWESVKNSGQVVKKASRLLSPADADECSRDYSGGKVLIVFTIPFNLLSSLLPLPGYSTVLSGTHTTTGQVGLRHIRWHQLQTEEGESSISSHRRLMVLIYHNHFNCSPCVCMYHFYLISRYKIYYQSIIHSFPVP